MTFFHELKRRNVIKVSIAYVIVAWLVLQVADVLLNNLEAPGWVFKLILLLLSVGLPITIFISWVFDWTPLGFQRTDDSSPENTLSTPNSAAEASGASVAVLPFVNMSDDPGNEYFSDGLTEELLNVLAKISGLKVAARTSSFHFKGQTGDIAEVGRRLGVATVLEGSVRQAGSRFRITAQLVNATSGYHLWSETFDRELNDIFAVQDEISSAVASALKVQLLDEDSDPQFIGGTLNTEAFQSYLMGVHYRNRGDREDTLRAAIDAFQAAINLDPEYAKAHVGLAVAWSLMAVNSFISYEEGISPAEISITKALELSPRLAEAYLAKGYLYFTLKQDIQVAHEAFNTALELHPGNVEVQMEYARINCYQGNIEEGIAAARKAVELDPVSLIANHFLGHILYFSRHYEEAMVALRHTLEMEPNYPKPHYFIAMSLYWLERYEEAWTEIQQEPLGWMNAAASSVILHRLGRIEEAETHMNKQACETDAEVAVIQTADTYAQWGDSESAIKHLQLAFDYGDPGLAQLKVDPFVDPIRDDARFIEIMEKLGFDTTPDSNLTE